MKPFRQGHLDRACGLYAVINGIRLAAKKDVSLPFDTCARLYEDLVEYLDEQQLTGSVFADGMCGNHISGVLRRAKTALEKHGLELTWTKPYHAGKAPPVDEWIERCARHIERGGTVVFGWEQDDGHWTVVRKITKHSLVLFDSSIFRRISISQITLDTQRKEHTVLDWRATYFVTVDIKEIALSI